MTRQEYSHWVHFVGNLPVNLLVPRRVRVFVRMRIYLKKRSLFPMLMHILDILRVMGTLNPKS